MRLSLVYDERIRIEHGKPLTTRESLLLPNTSIIS
jgi:hypothetical protein